MNLRDWRYGSTQSERLSGAVLHLEGYDSVDPQNPLGGPDGRKDLLCEKGGRRYVAACYFPSTPKEFSDVKEKLLHDNEGVEENGANGLAFFVNQPVTPSQRAELSRLVEPNVLDLFHLERIRTILDSPKGYGVRLEYLRIPMSNEEQLSLLSVINFRVDERLKEQTREIVAMRRSLQQVRMRTETMSSILANERSSLDEETNLTRYDFPTSDLSVGQLKWVHRIVTEGNSLPLAVRGDLRATEIWIGAEGGSRDEASFIPPPADQVPQMLEELLADWRTVYPGLVGADEETIVQALADFHHRFLTIHPFLDGNGRIARVVLQQQTNELLDRWVSATFTDEPAEYYQTLRDANSGDHEPLIRLIAANLE